VQPSESVSLLYRTDSIRRIEQAWMARLPQGELMRRAAGAVADNAARMARDLPRATPIVALVGPGNNGGDSLLAARLLADRGFPVRVVSTSPEVPSAADASAIWQAWHAHGGTIESLDALGALLEQRPLVIDGLFGIGLARPLGGRLASAVQAIGAAGLSVLAVDVPSGIDAERGAVVGGSDGVAVRAAVTVTMIGDKPGLHTGIALDHAGRVVVADLGLDVQPGDGRLFGAADAARAMPVRPRDTHKGSFGAVTVVGGAPGTIGAALLAARGAQASGAGKVFIASPGAPVFDPGQPQLMTRPLERALEAVDAACIGCGLGLSEAARHAVAAALRSELALVVDADALNLLVSEPALARALKARGAPSVLTPHPLEAARLLGRSAREIQDDRLGAAHALADALDATVVLKGAGSVVASPDGDWRIIDSGSPALAAAGTGDVLAGCVATLLAQGRDPVEAASLGAWLHGRAGDLWQRDHSRGIGLSAARLPHYLTEATNQ